MMPRRRRAGKGGCEPGGAPFGGKSRHACASAADHAHGAKAQPSAPIAGRQGRSALLQSRRHRCRGLSSRHAAGGPPASVNMGEGRAVHVVDRYEDPFVRIAAMIGGEEYLKVARSLLKSEDSTDEQIASSTGLRINRVRKILYDLFGKSLISGIRVKDERKGWFVYRWRSRGDEVENFIEIQKHKIGERLRQRLGYETGSDFYHCVNGDCQRVTFETALEDDFKCTSCGKVLNLKKNDRARKAFARKIAEIEKEMQYAE